MGQPLVKPRPLNSGSVMAPNASGPGAAQTPPLARHEAEKACENAIHVCGEINAGLERVAQKPLNIRSALASGVPACEVGAMKPYKGLFILQRIEGLDADALAGHLTVLLLRA
jgi:hypothetical protein